VPYWPEGSDGLGRLYQAVAHGCRAGRYQETRAKVYHDRIQRGSDGTQAFYSSRKLGLFGPDLAAVACFFAEPWDQPAPDLKPADQAWILNEAAYCLRALNRMAEARSPLRAGLEMQVKQADWESAAAAASNLSQLELLLGEVVAAQAMAAQTVDYAERSGNAFWRMASRAQLADALHQAGQAQAWQRFAEAEALQQERQPDYPLLYGLQGYLYCDGLLAQWECTAARAYLVPGTASLFGVQGLPCVDLAEPAPLGKASLALPIGEATLAAIEQRVMQTLAIAS
jgi:hypothetical protein